MSFEKGPNWNVLSIVRRLMWCRPVWYMIVNNNFRNDVKIIVKSVVKTCVWNTHCKDWIWVPGPKDGWTQAQQAQNNEFVESELKNWTKMIWITNKVGLNDKNRKIYWFKVKKIVLGIVQGDQFLYISCKFDYNFGSWLI